MNEAVSFLFIVAVPVVVAAGALVSLFAVGALFYFLEHPGEITSRIQAALRGRPKPSKPVPPDHYYKAYWSTDHLRGPQEHPRK
jgi:hypothetical protein